MFAIYRYLPIIVTTDCNPGYYGPGCSLQCSYCKNQNCRSTDGKCLQGCAGHNLCYEGKIRSFCNLKRDLCDQEKVFFTLKKEMFLEMKKKIAFCDEEEWAASDVGNEC